MWGRLREGAWPTQGDAFAAHLVKVMVLRSIQVAMKWQPMPAMARLPSGTLVLVLCGQPLQNQGWRSAPPDGTGAPGALAVASSTPRRSSMRARCRRRHPASSAAWRWHWRDDGRRQVGLGAQQPVLAGVGLAPFAAASCRPPPRRICPARWGARRPPVVELFLDLVFDDLALLFDDQDLLQALRRSSRVMVASSGHTTLTLCSRMPSRRQASSSRPRSNSAWRVSLKALPLAMMPKRSFGCCG
jgi:hypothetical protein